MLARPCTIGRLCKRVAGCFATARSAMLRRLCGVARVCVQGRRPSCLPAWPVRVGAPPADLEGARGANHGQPGRERRAWDQVLGPRRSEARGGGPGCALMDRDHLRSGGTRLWCRDGLCRTKHIERRTSGYECTTALPPVPAGQITFLWGKRMRQVTMSPRAQHRAVRRPAGDSCLSTTS